MGDIQFQTAIWHEDCEEGDPFSARRCLAYGYDVFGDLLGRASWSEYLLLLLLGERPEPWKVRVLESLAVALANPGPRDASVRAGMCAGVGGTTAAAILNASLAVGAGQLGGGRDLFLALTAWRRCIAEPAAWAEILKPGRPAPCTDIWPEMTHPPGFSPHAVQCPTPVLATLERLATLSSGTHLPWLRDNRRALEGAAACPLALSGVAAAALLDLGLGEEAAEILYLWLRLPGAMVHALEQKRLGWRKFPFPGSVRLDDDPGDKGLPDIDEFLP